MRALAASNLDAFEANDYAVGNVVVATSGQFGDSLIGQHVTAMRSSSNLAASSASGENSIAILVDKGAQEVHHETIQRSVRAKKETTSSSCSDCAPND